ncbi:retrotransposon protein, putative, ty1-copia subclass [Tanacetum coccineum]
MVCRRGEIETLLDMVRSMMCQTTLPRSFWDYALETAARILNMIPINLKKVDKSTYRNMGHGQRPLRYPKETMGYSFYSPSENKVFVARNAEFFESKLLDLKASGSVEDLKLIQEEDTNPYVDTSLNHEDDDQEIDKPQRCCLTAKSTKQSIFATSSTDVEYIAAFDASKKAVWIHKFIYGLGIVPTIEEPISMYCDNTGTKAIAKDDGVTKGARHFRAKVHYLRETIKMGDESCCFVYATVHNIQYESGWAYTGCKSCSTRVTAVTSKGASSSRNKKQQWYCKKHGETYAVVSRFKIIVLFFDESGMDADQYFPDEFNQIIEKKYLFKVKYSEFNHKNSSHVYRAEKGEDKDYTNESIEDAEDEDSRNQSIENNEDFTNLSIEIKEDKEDGLTSYDRTTNNGQASGSENKRENVIIDLSDYETKDGDESDNRKK